MLTTISDTSIQKQRNVIILFFAITITVLFVLMFNALSLRSEDLPRHYSPILLPEDINLPDTIAGYSILAVLNSDTTACIPTHVTRMILQPTVDENPSTYKVDAILEALEALGRDDTANLGFQFVGTSVTIEQITAENLRWNNQFVDRDCVRLGGPIHP